LLLLRKAQGDVIPVLKGIAVDQDMVLLTVAVLDDEGHAGGSLVLHASDMIPRNGLRFPWAAGEIRRQGGEDP
jgi:hypothetical protein